MSRCPQATSTYGPLPVGFSRSLCASALSYFTLVPCRRAHSFAQCKSKDNEIMMAMPQQFCSGKGHARGHDYEEGSTSSSFFFQQLVLSDHTAKNTIDPKGDRIVRRQDCSRHLKIKKKTYVPANLSRDYCLFILDYNCCEASAN